MDPLLMGGDLDKSGEHVGILPGMANRHGVITGATGTGKTVTLQCIAENFSRIGVPVFVSDVKGDFSGVQTPGSPHEKVDERLEAIGIDNFEFAGNPVEFWDVFGEKGTAVRTTVSEMGPVLMARLLGLSEAQTGVLNICFRVADDEGMLLLDLKDLRLLLKFVGDNSDQYESEYGNIASTSVGAVQRSLLGLEDQGGNVFFGEPDISIKDMIRTDQNGKGIINILAADKLMQNPKIYSTFLLWLLSELFEELPEAGDPDKPVMAFFFDEAHLLFDEAPKALLEKIEQVVKLIRSKGVGVYFITQNPLDIPDPVLAQLGNRVQHALRAYTPREQKAVKAAAGAFRQNPDLDTEKVITELGVGEALVSFLDEKGAPSVVRRTLIRPPYSQIGPLENAKRDQVINSSMLYRDYKDAVDKESAYEILQKRIDEKALAEEEAAEAKAKEKEEKKSSKGGRKSNSERLVGNVIGSFGSKIGREIARGVLGGILRK